MKTTPPRLGFWFLRLLRRQGDSDLVLGDLEEEYAYLYHRQGLRAARRWYWHQVVRSVPRFTYELVYWWIIMLENYLKVAVRNLRKYPGFATINIAGLALGLAACFVITLFLIHKLSYDRFHPHADRMYRVVQDTQHGVLAAMPPGLAQALEESFPELEQVTQVARRLEGLFSHEGESFFLEDLLIVDPAFLKVFAFDVLQGNPETLFTTSDQVVLTASEAKRLFGDRTALGRVLRYENARDVEVVGIVADPPLNAHFRFNALLAQSDRQRDSRNSSVINWSRYGDNLYVLLNEGQTAVAFEANLQAFEEAAEQPEWIEEDEISLHVERVVDIHLYSDAEQGLAPQSDVRYLYLFGAIAVLILLIAGVNYMNLTTARATMRYREVGVRKAVGARPRQLVGQFLSEAVVVALAAFGLALALIYLTLPALKQVAEIDFTFSYLQYIGITAFFVLIVMGFGMFAGSYPAFFLARFKAIYMLGGGYAPRGKGRLRTLLIVFQFASSVVLLVATTIMFQQQRYVEQQRLGFDEERVVFFRTHDVGEQFAAFRDEAMQNTAVEQMTAGALLGLGWKSYTMGIPNKETGDMWELSVMGVNHDFVETMGLRVVQGRTFSRDFPADAEQHVLINEHAAVQFGIAEDPLGEKVPVMGGNRLVVGVVEDFHNESLHTPISPLVMALDPDATFMGLARLTPNRVQEGLQQLEATWARFQPDRPLAYQFLGERIRRHYQTEQRLGRLFSLFAGLAVIIACMGMFGLAAFTAEQRTKEIGIRKAVGASTGSIVTLLSAYFVKLVAVGIAIATPIGYFIMHEWLATYAYHIELGVLPFVGVGCVIIALALGAVGYQAYKAASANPVEALRYE